MSFDPLVRHRAGLFEVLSVPAFAVALLACNPKGERGEAAATAAASSSAAPSSAAPSSAAPSGPLGTVRGTITVKGDPPPALSTLASEIPLGKCFFAHEMYSELFREGPGRTLADVLVAVTEFEGRSSEPEPRVTVEAKDCAFASRTIAMSLGQTLSVKNVGKETHTPQLLGLQSPALLLAIPGGDPIEFTPKKLGQYQLVDRTHRHAFADVFVMTFSTVDVTGLDGKFEITGVPAGKAQLSALLPITGQTLERHIEVPAGRAIEVNLEFEFDAARDGAKASASEVP